MPDISHLLLPLDKEIDEFTGTLLQNRNISKTDRDLISLPAKMGGLGIIIPSKVSSTQYQNYICHQAAHTIREITENGASFRRG